MKKVLSVLLAAAMVMGMSVSAMAANFSVTSNGKTACDLVDFAWNNAYLVREDKVVDKTANDAGATIDISEFKLEAGDEIYFSFTADIKDDGLGLIVPTFMPKDWTLKIENAEYVVDGEFVQADDITGLNDDQLYVKVELEDDFDHFEAAEAKEVVEFYMYVKDLSNKYESEKANVHYGFKGYDKKVVGNPATMADVDVDLRDVIKADANTKYTLHKDIKTSKTVVFEIAEEVLVTVKMWPGETYLIKGSVNSKWSKELSKEYDEDIKVITLNTDMDVREILVEAKKDNKQVVEVVDGALVAVESEYVTKYEVIEDVELSKGYIADLDGDCTFAVIDADIELIVPEVEAEVEADKANPETGAADFVGAAVAMAVVSVAAAGALALKK